MTKALHVDTDRCAGHGRCYSLVPELFDSDEFGYPVMIRTEVPDHLADKAGDAVRNCPEHAISLVE